MIIVFGVIEFGFIWMQSHYIANAAREGARVAARLTDPTVNGSADQLQVEQRIKEYLEDLPFYEDKVTDCCDSGDFIYVEIEDENIVAGSAGDIDAVKVSVTVQTTEVWDPILWDLVRLLKPDAVNTPPVSEFAVFAVEQ
jgi:Flp pilus assembly protein TadG